LDAKVPDAVKRSGSEIGLLMSHTGIDESKSVEGLMNPVSKKYLLSKPGVNQHFRAVVLVSIIVVL